MTAPRFLFMTNTNLADPCRIGGHTVKPDEQRRTWPQSHIPRGANRSGSALLQLCEPVAADRLQRTGQKLGILRRAPGNPRWETRLDEKKLFRFVAKAKQADTFM